MKRNLKKIVVLLIICLLNMFALSILVLAADMNTEVNFDDLAEEYVMEQVAEFIDLSEENITWNDTTQIKSYTTLYAPDNTINGYIFRFETDGQDSGYMQIGVLEQEYYVVNLGFDGQDYLTKILEAYNESVFSIVVSDSEDLLTISLEPSFKVYYTGGFNYYIYDSADRLVDLVSCKIKENGIGDLTTEYELYKNDMEINLTDNINATENTISPAATSESYTVKNAYNAQSYMKSMSYYSGYSNHCTPTAATNMVMYWKYGRGFFSSNSSNPTTVFKWFYTNMGTSSSNGTTWSKIKPAYANYFSSNSGASTESSGTVTSVTFSKIKTKINSDIPVHLEVESYDGGDNHSVNVWGYSVANSINYLRISDNWGSSVTYSLIKYSSYSYGQYVYYNLN